MSTPQSEVRDFSPLYLYAIVPSVSDGTVLQMDGIADRVSMIGAGHYAAVVGDGNAQDLKGRSREELGQLLVTHQRVVEQIMRTTPLLPVQFGTQVPDELGVRTLLQRGSSLFESAFAEFRDCCQFEILITWDVDAVLAAIAAEEPIASLKAELLSSTSASTSEREAFGRCIKDALEQRRSALSACASAVLRAAAIDGIVHPVADDRVVLHLSLLVKNDALAAIDQKLEALDAEFGGSICFRCVGPMPPSSFATVHVDFLDAGAIERARVVLDVDAQASLDDVRSVYHQRTKTVHPDIGGTEGTQAMAELTEAYKVLTLDVRARQAGPAGHEPHGLDAVADTRAVLVSLRRQDSAAETGAANG